MINDLDETIKALLVQGVPLNPSEIDVVFDAPTSEWSSSLARPTVNCYMYHMAENHDLRNADWESDYTGQGWQAGSPYRHGVARRKAPYRIDTFYLVTAWANAIEDEHRLIWRILATLMRYTVIPEERLQGLLTQQEYAIPLKIAQPETPIKNPSDFWGSMEVHIKPSVHVTATLALDPDLFAEVPLVLTRRIRAYPTTARESGDELPTIQFGGWVTEGEPSGPPVPLADVQIVERDVTVQSDEAGRFKFDNVPHGHYTLRVSLAGTSTERQIDVPGENYDVVLPGRKDGEASSSEPREENPPSPHQGGKGRRR